MGLGECACGRIRSEHVKSTKKKKYKKEQIDEETEKHGRDGGVLHEMAWYNLIDWIEAGATVFWVIQHLFQLI